MTCAACVRRVESALESVEGVTNALVNLAAGSAKVIHQAKWADIEGLKKAVTEAGYEFLGVLGQSLDDHLEKTQIKEIKDLKIKFIFGAIASLAVFAGSMQEWFPFLSSIPKLNGAKTVRPLFSKEKHRKKIMNDAYASFMI